MTQHSIEELKRQVDAAKRKADAAQKSLTEAEARLQAAREQEARDQMEADGFPVGRAIVKRVIRHYGGSESTIDPELLASVECKWRHTSWYFSPLKADGTPSNRQSQRSFDRLELVRILPEDEQP